jgi:hypothetical protein
VSTIWTSRFDRQTKESKHGDEMDIRHTATDEAELKLKARMDELFRIRRQYLKADTDRKAVVKAGSKCFETFKREFRASLKPKRGRAGKV